MTENAYQEMSDIDLINLTSNANKDAFEVLVKRHANRLYAMIYRMKMGETVAEDVMQDVLIKVWQKAGTYDANRGAAVTTWMTQIAYHRCIDLKRKKGEFYADELPVQTYDEPLQDEKLDEKKRAEQLHNALDKLPERQRAAVILCHLQGFSQKEAAEVLQTSVKAIESLLVRSKKALKSILEAVAI